MKVYYFATILADADYHESISLKTGRLVFSTKEKALNHVNEKILPYAHEVKTDPNYPDTWQIGKTIYKIEEITVL